MFVRVHGFRQLYPHSACVCVPRWQHRAMQAITWWKTTHLRRTASSQQCKSLCVNAGVQVIDAFAWIHRASRWSFSANHLLLYQLYMSCIPIWTIGTIFSWDFEKPERISTKTRRKILFLTPKLSLVEWFDFPDCPEFCVLQKPDWGNTLAVFISSLQASLCVLIKFENGTETIKSGWLMMYSPFWAYLEKSL